MKKILLVSLFIVILTIGLFTLTGCQLTLETNENSVSASVDEETTEHVGGIIDWIVDRLDRIFVTEDKVNQS